MNDNDIKVSVVCITYNQDRYIEDAIKGFLKQKTNFKFEIIIHDDASTDHTIDIINKYSSLYPEKIKTIFEKENQYSQCKDFVYETIVPNLNSEYVALCEGDDYWIDPFKLQKQIDFLDSNANYVACAHNSMKVDGQTDSELGELFHINDDVDLIMEDAISNTGILYQTATLVYRRSDIYDFINSDIRKIALQRRVGDHPLRIYLLTKGKVRILNEIMAVYRYNSQGSWTQQLYKRQYNPKYYLMTSRYYHAVNKYAGEKYTNICKTVICDNLLMCCLCKRRYELYKKILLIRLEYPFSSRKQKIKHLLKFIFSKFFYLKNIYKR